MWFIDDPQQLAYDDVLEVMGAANIVALDAEWPPETTSHHPSASVLQVASWSRSHGLKVFVFDLMTLCNHVKELGKDEDNTESLFVVLKDLFERHDVLKLGWSFANDFRALRRAFRNDFARHGSLSTINSILDLHSLHRYLLHHHATHIHAPLEQGLSGVLMAQFGAPLDKTEQCSTWGKRPLTTSQLHYAAVDACCLLGLFDDYLAVAPDSLLDSARPRVNDADGSGHGAKLEDDPSLVSRTETDSLNLHSEDDLSLTAPGDERRSPVNDRLGSVSVDLDLDEAHPAVRRAFEVTWSDDLIVSVLKTWAERWEMDKSTGNHRFVGTRIHRSGGLTTIALSQRRRTVSAAKKSKSKDFLRGVDAFPSYVPWMDRARRLIGTPRFLADVMLQGAARQLRLWGFDAEHIDTVEKNQRHMVHRQLVQRAEEEGRVILTRDISFMHRRLSDQAYFVHAIDKKSQVGDSSEDILCVYQVHRYELYILSISSLALQGQDLYRVLFHHNIYKKARLEK